MSARQGKIAVAGAIVVLTGLLLYRAMVTGNWVGFVVTEVGLLVPMAISWWVLARHGDS